MQPQAGRCGLQPHRIPDKKLDDSKITLETQRVLCNPQAGRCGFQPHRISGKNLDGSKIALDSQRVYLLGCFSAFV